MRHVMWRSANTPPAEKRYVHRGRNELHTIFERHFADFCEQYDEKYAATYGMYRRERIHRIGERFSPCGDYFQSVARIRITNPPMRTRLLPAVLPPRPPAGSFSPVWGRAHQTIGDTLCWNLHFHAIVLEGGFDNQGSFFYIPFSGLQSMVEVFGCRVVKLLVARELLNEQFARNLLS